VQYEPRWRLFQTEKTLPSQEREIRTGAIPRKGGSLAMEKPKQEKPRMGLAMSDSLSIPIGIDDGAHFDDEASWELINHPTASGRAPMDQPALLRRVQTPWDEPSWKLARTSPRDGRETHTIPYPPHPGTKSLFGMPIPHHPVAETNYSRRVRSDALVSGTEEDEGDILQSDK